MNTPTQWAERVYHPSSVDEKYPGKSHRTTKECVIQNTALFEAAILAARLDEREKVRKSK